MSQREIRSVVPERPNGAVNGTCVSLFADDAVFCSPFPLSIPPLRVLLTTAHTQVYTVIRFSPSRFVPPSDLSIVLGILLSLRPAADLSPPQLCLLPTASQAAQFFLHSNCVQRCWTLICASSPENNFWFYPFFHTLITILQHNPSPFLSSFLHTLFFSSVSATICPCLHLRWSSPGTTMAFSTENRPTPFRDAF